MNESGNVADDDELTRLEEELAVIEAAMDRIENGDLESYDRLVAQLSHSEEHTSVKSLLKQEKV